jgi:hypothetical protein
MLQLTTERLLGSGSPKGYGFGMREFVRRILVSIFIAAFVVSGAAWAACIDLPVGPASTSSSHHHAGMGGHGDRHIGEENTVTSDQGPVSHGHGIVVKCCSMAPVFSLPPELAVRSIDFPRLAAAFRFVQRGMVGHIVALEPGIPKSIF